MSETFTSTRGFVVHACINSKCGVLFALEKVFDAERVKDHVAFYCPNGHSQWYSGKSEAERLRADLERANRDKQDLLDQVSREQLRRAQVERSARTTRGHLTRTKNRIRHGVCPCCNRTFENIARHMDTQHPDYAKAEPRS
jgi:hypothetical protein